MEIKEGIGEQPYTVAGCSQQQLWQLLPTL
jgi:hypothetical protein